MNGLTRGGEALLRLLLDPEDKISKHWIRVMEQIMSATKDKPSSWPLDATLGVHITDAEDGVTLDDYKLIKATLMMQGKWTA